MIDPQHTRHRRIGPQNARLSHSSLDGMPETVPMARGSSVPARHARKTPPGRPSRAAVGPHLRQRRSGNFVRPGFDPAHPDARRQQPIVRSSAGLMRWQPAPGSIRLLSSPGGPSHERNGPHQVQSQLVCLQVASVVAWCLRQRRRHRPRTVRPPGHRSSLTVSAR